MTRLDEIKARLAAATPGPWAWSRTPAATNDYDHGILWSASNREVIEVVAPADGPEIETTKADAALIANAPADLALLVEAVERLLPCVDVYSGRVPDKHPADDYNTTWVWLRERGLVAGGAQEDGR